MIAIGVGLTSFLVRMGTNFTGRATPLENPENVRITNISDASFTVSYKTQGTVFGSISYGLDENMGTSVGDQRDQQTGNFNPYRIHSITVRNLKPSTKYFFAITSGQNTFLNKDKSFEVATGSKIAEEPNKQEPIVGKVTSQQNSLDETIVYLSLENGQMASTLVKPDGNYILPLNSIRTKDLNSYFSFSQETILNLLIMGISEESSVTLMTKQINPVPVVTLSKNYDFSLDNSEVATPSSKLGFPSFSANESATKKSQILTPKKDEGFTDQQPVFKGTAPAGSDVKILVQSTDEIQTTVKTDKNGNWSFRPKKSLSPGEHKISITTIDASGIIRTITQSFTVYAQGSQVSESATPSATPTITLTTPTSTPSTTPMASPSPTLILTPTFTPTPTTPAISASITPKPPLANPGSSSLLIAGITVLTTSIIGIILFLTTRGASSL